MLNNEKYDDGKIPKHRSGNLYNVFKYEPENVKQQGQWNTAKIMQKNGHVKLFLNGRIVIEYTIGSDEYKKLFRKANLKTIQRGGIIPKDILYCKTMEIEFGIEILRLGKYRIKNITLKSCKSNLTRSNL